MNAPAETDTPSARSVKRAAIVSVITALVAPRQAGLHTAFDLAFNTADLPLPLPLDDVAPRYRQHFFGA